ncbi:MAG: SRPBCC family protein [Armatimonadetes bacterium]|nr:SRPBCC family protein [Armatimonadota bacterium]
MPRRTENSICIRAPMERVFAAAAAVERWPEILPHYRWVRILEQEGNRRTVEMAARRGWIPVRWGSHQWLWPETGRITFEHISGLSRGMRVVWELQPRDDAVQVTIRHELALKHPLLRTRLGQWVVGEVFVRSVAGRTLATLKRVLESE